MEFQLREKKKKTVYKNIGVLEVCRKTGTIYNYHYKILCTISNLDWILIFAEIITVENTFSAWN